MGMSIRQKGHFRVVGSGVSWWLKRATSMLIGLMTKKNTASAIVSNAISRVSRSRTIPCTTAPKAAPITMPTARSTTLPRSTKVLNSPSKPRMGDPSSSPGTPGMLIADDQGLETWRGRTRGGEGGAGSVGDAQRHRGADVGGLAGRPVGGQERGDRRRADEDRDRQPRDREADAGALEARVVLEQ